MLIRTDRMNIIEKNGLSLIKNRQEVEEVIKVCLVSHDQNIWNQQ